MIHTIARYYNTLGAQGADVVRVLNQEGRGPENHYNSIPQDVYKERLFEISSVNQTWLAGKTLNMIKKKGRFSIHGNIAYRHFHSASFCQFHLDHFDPETFHSSSMSDVSAKSWMFTGQSGLPISSPRSPIR
jgi:hypothetical protein